jgi:hypothetical protein
MKAKLTEADFSRAARDLDVPVAVVRAFAEVESRGDGFLPDGHPVVLFERHIMYRRTKAKYGFTRADALVKQYPDIINPKAGGYGKTSEQPGRMDRAAKLIDRECALESASWGAFQVMGFNWQPLGYPTLQAFINAMYHSEGDHLDSFVRYIKVNPSLHKALKAQDWPRVALGYNGPDYAINKYDTKLAAAFARHRTA